MVVWNGLCWVILERGPKVEMNKSMVPGPYKESFDNIVRTRQSITQAFDSDKADRQ